MKHAYTSKGSRAMKIAALGLALFMILGVSAPTPAKAAALKEEVVYVRLFHDGSVDEVYVVNSFELDEDQQIVDYGNYGYVQNLSGTDPLKLEDGVVSIDAAGGRLYYEGYLMDPQLPWTIKITYLLNGAEIAPGQLAGQSGALEIRIDTAANPQGSRELFERYCLQVAITLDSSLCRDIVAESGTVAAAGGSKQVNFVVLPGQEAQLTVSADVIDFTMPAITVAGVTLSMDFDLESVDLSDLTQLTDGLVELDDGVQDLLDGIFDLRDGTKELYDGARELGDGSGGIADGISDLAEGTEGFRDGLEDLANGVSDMADGAQDLSDGAGDLVDGMREFTDGVGDLKDGMLEFHKGVGDLVDGSKELYLGLTDIVDGSRDLYSGAMDFYNQAQGAAGGGAQLAQGFSDIYDGILALVNAQLSDYGLQVTRENYQSQILDFLYGTAISAARQQIEANVYTQENQDLVLAGILQQAGIDPDVFAALGDEDATKIMILAQRDAALAALVQEALDAQMDQIKAGAEAGGAELLGLVELLEAYEQLLGGLDSYVTGVGGITSGIGTLGGGLGTFTGGLEQYRDGMGQYLGGVYQLHDGSEELYYGVADLKTGSLKLLDGMIQLRDGIVAFRDGVVELHGGVIELFDGMVELHGGVVKLNDGMVEFNDGVLTLVDGIGTLVDGTQELYEGVEELKDGTGEIREQTATLDTDLVDGIQEAVADIMGGDGPVYSFVSGQNGEVGAVQFVMQTEGIALPDAETAEAAPEAEATLWQRFLRLFGF